MSMGATTGAPRGVDVLLMVDKLEPTMPTLPSWFLDWTCSAASSSDSGFEVLANHT
jgi:hypothetical protein